jgi:membrane-anchored protein YejM (alkaline phosphatase superfamily)
MLIKITLNNRPVKSISKKKYTYYLITNLDFLHLTLSLYTSKPLTKPRHKKTLLQSLKS